MFLGHLAAGLAAKRLAPKADLGWLLLASELVDVLFFGAFLLGWEEMRIEPGRLAATPLSFPHYPWTHSLAGSLLWSAAAAGLYLAVTRYAAGAMATFVAVSSHWFLDAISHAPDLPILPGGAARVGLGLWVSAAGTLLVEGALFAAGVLLYATMGKAKDRTGKYGGAALVGLVVLMYGGGMFGPPPPGTAAVAVSGLIMTAVIMAWASWVDRHRG